MKNLYRTEISEVNGEFEYYQQEWGWDSLGFSHYRSPTQDTWSIMIGPWIWVIPHK